MMNFSNLLTAEKRHELVLSIFLSFFIIFDMEIPDELAVFVNSPLGNIIIILLAISLFATGNILLGLLGLVAADMLIKRASRDSVPLHKVAETKKLKKLAKYNHFPVTLEEEVVSEMAPLVTHQSAKADYHDHLPFTTAASIHDNSQH
jgi:hypothetical protein